ncbi:AraC family transcriptional regulator [Acinetobacter larvae]|uniref:AraC family transcriptional regulator n=1 Tax=Acinetobacter larvae TaxID=1789224 RepID=A0A1B2M1Q6_9GAMM|nr:helix-turn-helix transcriptional regulator [Acinetobacter larvae]AOA58953.1 AraC family transcriptional regulator [Acinetobacter larvae]
MKQVSIHSVEHLPQQIIAIENQYADHQLLPSHHHQRAQLLYGAQGVIQIETPDGNWIIPPERAVWIPPQVSHQLTMYKVRTCSLYIRPEHCPRQQQHCEVLAISPLFRQLLLTAPLLPTGHNPYAQLIFQLIHWELKQAQVIQQHLPLPQHAGLLAACQTFLAQPNIHYSPQHMAAQLHVSERHFSRLFKKEVGYSFSQWRQHACVLLSLEKIMNHQPIQKIAYDLGFKNPAAFSNMFHRVLGLSPSQYYATH